MPRVLVRVYRDPFRAPSATAVLERDLIGHNNGNLLFSDAAVKTLATPTTEVTTWTARQMRRRADELDERFDHLVLPLANVLRPDYAPRLRELTELVGRTSRPVTVLGIGAQGSLEGGFEDLAPVADDVKAFVSCVLDRSPSIGVRGEMTAGYLRGLGFSDVEVIGCPSMFTAGPHLPATRVPTARPSMRLAVNLNRSLPVPPGLVASLLAQHPDSVYFPQDLSDLRVMSWGRTSRQAGPRSVDEPLLDNARFHLDPESWVEDLAAFDLAWGTRIHGNVAAVLAGTAAVLAAHDSRTRELADYLQLPWVRLDALGDRFDVEALLHGHDFGGAVAGHAGRFDRFAAFLASHGLAHSWSEGDGAATWTARRAPAHRSEPVVVERGRPADTRSQLAWLRQQVVEDRARERARTQRQERQLERQRARLARQRAALDRSAARVGELERRLGELEGRLERRPAARLRTAARTWRRRPGR